MQQFQPAEKHKAEQTEPSCYLNASKKLPKTRFGFGTKDKPHTAQYVILTLRATE